MDCDRLFSVDSYEKIYSQGFVCLFNQRLTLENNLYPIHVKCHLVFSFTSSVLNISLIILWIFSFSLTAECFTRPSKSCQTPPWCCILLIKRERERRRGQCRTNCMEHLGLHGNMFLLYMLSFKRTQHESHKRLFTLYNQHDALVNKRYIHIKSLHAFSHYREFSVSLSPSPVSLSSL